MAISHSLDRVTNPTKIPVFPKRRYYTKKKKKMTPLKPTDSGVASPPTSRSRWDFRDRGYCLFKKIPNVLGVVAFAQIH
jgi:hypothetical protein